jgi:hypothetical protein
VGLTSVPEPWKSVPWRFLVTGLLNPERSRREAHFVLHDKNGSDGG